MNTFLCAMHTTDRSGRPFGGSCCWPACSSAFASRWGSSARTASPMGSRRRHGPSLSTVVDGIVIDVARAWYQPAYESPGPGPLMKMNRRLSCRRNSSCRWWSLASYSSCSCGSATAVSRRSRPIAAVLPAVCSRTSANTVLDQLIQQPLPAPPLSAEHGPTSRQQTLVPSSEPASVEASRSLSRGPPPVSFSSVPQAS